jgi:hypothetical protein
MAFVSVYESLLLMAGEAFEPPHFFVSSLIFLLTPFRRGARLDLSKPARGFATMTTQDIIAMTFRDFPALAMLPWLAWSAGAFALASVGMIVAALNKGE